MIDFSKPYKKEIFSNFLEDFLPEDYSEKEKELSEISGCQIIKDVKEVGYCESLDLTVFEMSHDKETDPRVTIATDAFKIMKNYDVQRALVVFKNDDTENYRFSYLTIALELSKGSKVKKTYSNARRYSFILGPGAKIKTPDQQLVGKGRVKDPDDLLDRFSLEVVNKQFYLDIADFFDELVDDNEVLVLPGNDHNLKKNFSVRLIGRIMFCWFLKQKLSSAGQLVPDEILSSQSVKKDYYHNVLERLFFEVLNTNIEDRDIRDSYFDKVPYLNGGLFNPGPDDFYDLDRSTFNSKFFDSLKINDEWFKDFFTLLETYNFTIDENTIFDQELSVDPEMLGRIFENLLAEINPETGTSERKRTGSYYTPRHIVEYMVDQSLLEYFKKKTVLSENKISALISYDQLDDPEYLLSDSEKEQVVQAANLLRILDPACGSGAFPIGILQKIVYILQVVDSTGELWRNKKLEKIPELYRQKIEQEFGFRTLDYIRKLEVIKNSIFGVDNQSIAVEVSRLRCFLTLVVESEIDDSKKNRGIESLPNLDFKFVCANTLIPAPEESDTETNKLFSDEFQERLASSIDRYFSSTGENKRSANNEIHKLIDGKVEEKMRHLNQLVSYNGDQKVEIAMARNNKNQIDEHSRILNLWDSYKNIFENKPVDFFDVRYFFPDVKDGFDIVIGNPPYGILNKKQNKSKSIVVTSSELDYFKHSKKYKAAKGGMLNIFRLFIVRSLDLLKNDGIFVEIFPLAFVCDLTAVNLRKFILEDTQPISIDAFPERDNHKKRVFEAVKMSVCILITRKSAPKEPFSLRINKDKFIDYSTQKTYLDLNKIKVLDDKNYSIPLASSIETELLTKIYLNSYKFSKIGTCNTGEIDMTFCKEAFTADSKNTPLLKGAIIDRYVLRKKMSQGEIVYIDEEKLSKIRTIDTDLKIKPRIVLQGITGVNEKLRLKMMIISEAYCANSLNYLNFKSESENLRFMLGLFNSKVMNFVFSRFSTNSNVNGYEINNLPIPKKTNPEIINKISDYVAQIISDKAGDDVKDTSELECEVNDLVMDLYDLNDEEKDVIRKS
ncbi:Eco57I restriction-modification methylase domain-containing protein [Candidatus Nomurabacteria bacterium]|nr:Eco57I restriction-modification methylase domain-containing protein [Candidatus Nomurabacteria bacterium]